MPEILCPEPCFTSTNRNRKSNCSVFELTAFPKLLDLVRMLRTDLASSVAILLVNAGKLRPEQARQWVRADPAADPSRGTLKCSPSDRSRQAAKTTMSTSRRRIIISWEASRQAMLGRRGAAELKLSGQVDPEVFRSVFRGYHPSTGAAMVQNAGYSDRQCAWDFTFSVPKSVCIVWSVVSPEIRLQIQKFQQLAVAADPPLR